MEVISILPGNGQGVLAMRGSTGSGRHFVIGLVMRQTILGMLPRRPWRTLSRIRQKLHIDVAQLWRSAGR